MTQKEVIKTDSAPQPIGPYSQAILAGNTLYVSGQVALDPISGQMIQTDIPTETRQVMANLKSIIEKAGFTFDQVVKTTIFLTDLNDFALVNEVYGSFFGQQPPARETVQVVKLPRNARVEISMILVR